MLLVFEAKGEREKERLGESGSETRTHWFQKGISSRDGAPVPKCHMPFSVRVAV